MEAKDECQPLSSREQTKDERTFALTRKVSKKAGSRATIHKKSRIGEWGWGKEEE